jgi:hypothetical protein
MCIHGFSLELPRSIYARLTYGNSWQGNHQIYGHIQCICLVLANPIPLVIPL